MCIFGSLLGEYLSPGGGKLRCYKLFGLNVIRVADPALNPRYGHIHDNYFW